MPDFDQLWKKAQENPLVRVLVIYGGASWFIVQLASTLGARPSQVRLLAIGFGFGFVLIGLGGWLVARRKAALAPAKVESEAAARRRRLLNRRSLSVAIIFLLLGSGAWWARPRLLGGTVAPGAELIAVLPFHGAGTVAEEYGLGMVDLLSTNLDQIGGVRTVSARTVMSRWTQRAEAGPLDDESTLDVGRDVDAGSVLTGTVAVLGEEIRLTAVLRGIDGGRLATAEVDGATGDVIRLVDELSVKLLAEIWRAREPIPSLSIAAVTSASLPAIRAYLRGERHYREARWDSSYAAFEEAVAQDSTFALAYARLAEVEGWMAHLGSGRAFDHAEAALRHAARLPERERALVTVGRLHSIGDPAALDSAAAYVARYPDDPMGWYRLGDAAFHAPFRSMSIEETLHAFERGHALDPSFAVGQIHLLDYATATGDSALFNRHFAGFQAGAAPEAAAAYEARWRVRMAPASGAVALMRELASGERGHALKLENVVAARLLFDPTFDPEAAVRLIDAIPGASSDPNIAQLRVGLLIASGRAEFAAAYMRETAPPEFAQFDALLGGLAGTGDVARSKAFVERIAHVRPTDPLSLVFARAVAIGTGESRLSRKLRLPESIGQAGESGARILRIQTALDAWERMLEGDSAAVGALGDALARVPYAIDNGYQMALTPAAIDHAAHLAADPATNEEAINRLVALLGPSSGLFAAAIWLALGDAYTHAGQHTDAVTAYAHVERLLRGADAPARPMLASAERALQRLSTDRAPVVAAPAQQ